MATPAVDPIDAFFTLERLAYYRDLHARYPLWCGGWPDAESTHPEAFVWRPRLVSRDVLQGAPSEYLGFDFRDEASKDFVPQPVFHIEDWNHLSPQGDPVVNLSANIDPPYKAALAAAANYTFVPWGTDLRKYGGISKRPSEVFASAAFEAVDANSTTIWNFRLDFLRARTTIRRNSARRRLETVWRSVGEQSGILPSAKGGNLCFLTPSFLRELVEEAINLVKDVLVYSTDATTITHVRELDRGHESLGEMDRELLQSLRRQDNPDPEVIARLEARIDVARDTQSKARHLAFPILSKLEIDQMFSVSAGRTGKRIVHKIGTQLLADRLPITKKTLLHLIAS